VNVLDQPAYHCTESLSTTTSFQHPKLPKTQAFNTKANQCAVDWKESASYDIQLLTAEAEQCWC